VELAVNGQVVVPKTSVMTGTDRYLKQGVYRLAGITPDSTVFHDGMVRATSPEDVAWPSAGAAAATSSAGGTGQADAGASAQNDSPSTEGGPATGCSATGGAPSLGLLALVGIILFRSRRMDHAVATDHPVTTERAPRHLPEAGFRTTAPPTCPPPPQTVQPSHLPVSSAPANTGQLSSGRFVAIPSKD
jgi:uncharacterized protein (TIGR03382 family)